MGTLSKLLLIAVMIFSRVVAIDITPDDKQHSTIIEKNHFYSNYEINTTYDITKVNVDKPIILYLKKKDENTLFNNNITITLISGDKSSQCYFTSFDKMCFLNDLPNPSMKLKIKCDSLPCEASWTILQPPVKKAQQQQSISDLFDISESNKHMIAAVTCNNPEVKDFNSKVQAYSQSEYIRGHTNNIVYYLFSKESKGHLYFKIQESAKSCAQMGIYNVSDSMAEGKNLKDFILKNQKSVFKFNSRPKNQFRLDASMHQLMNQPIASELEVRIMGDKDGSTEKIYTSKIGPGFGTTVYDFSYVIPAIDEQYSNLKIQFQSTDKIIMLNFELHENTAQIEAAEHSHFAMKNGQSLKYQLIGDNKASDEDKLKIIIPNKGKVSSDKQECSKKQGCSFVVTALDNVSSLLYIGVSENSKQDEIQKKEVEFIEFTDKITHKVREDDIVYFKKSVEKDKYFQVLVNNPNVILYASSVDKCQVPSEQCYEKIGNFHNPFIYAPQKNSDLYIAVEGLENCEFTITTLSEGEGAIQLKDNQPFAYLMDEHETTLTFSFKNPEKEGLSINLIAPIQDLLLVVRQGDQNPDPDEDFVSLQGFASFSKSEITEKQVRFTVQKTQNSKDKYVHFSLIVSTSGANLRLDPSHSHYETLKPKQKRDYVFEFDTQKDYLLNFYVHNLGKENLKLPIMVSNEDKWTDKKVQHFQIQEATDTLNLKDVSEELCHEEGEVKCQIFVRIANSMDVEVDLTLTLIIKDSVIQLKDGLWQSYAINEIAQTAHFYFVPRNSKKSISIVYRSNYVDLGIVFSIWKTDEKNVNPEEWPFPTYTKQKNNQLDHFKPLNHIVIDHEALKDCWPSCIVLLSLYKKSESIIPQVPGNFALMASNEILELPEKVKTDVFLKAGQNKFIMIDLKYALDKEQLTFFRNSILGFETLYANVYSEKNQRCPEDYDGDFSFGEVETIIKMNSIKTKMSENDMEDDENIYLCITARGAVQSKFNLEYSTDEDEIKVLKYDTFENIALSEKTLKIFQMQAWQAYEIKVTREKGYFYIKIAVCDGETQGGYEQCLEKLEDQDEKGKKIVAKTEQFSEKPCPKCIVYIKLEADEPAELIIHVQSKFSTLELKQKDTIADFTNEGQENKYTLTSVQAEQTIISVEVTEGEPVVTVTDYGQLNIVKEKDEKTNNIHIVIPPIQQSSTAVSDYGTKSYYGFKYTTTFRYLGVRISSKNPKMPCAYSISYSSGERESYLEDGLLLGYTLQPKVISKFLYKSQNPSLEKPGYIMISMNKSSTLYNVELKMYTYEDPYDEQTRTQVTPQKPPMRKKTPNPTMIFTLPISKLVSIELQSAEQAKVTLMVNHQEIVMLPYNEEFPFQVMKNQKINLMTDINNPGYLLVYIRKCDESEPTFGYTFNYDSFDKGEFEYTTSLENDPKFQFYIKASKIGTLYMQLNNNEITDGIYSIKIVYSEKKITTEKIRTGNNGLIQYSIIDSKKALVKFKGIVCATGRCEGNSKYFWVAGTNLQDVYSQTLCPLAYFLITNAITVNPLKFNEITTHGSDQISFEYPLLDHTSYIAIKAVSGNEEVYYRPLEIVTLWGSINKTGTMHKIVMGTGGFIVFCMVLVVYRRACRSHNQHYDQLSQDARDYD